MSSNAQTIINTIITQVQQLLNIHVVNSINTGNRTIDNSLTVIINSLLVLVGTWFYCNAEKLINMLYNPTYEYENKSDNPTEINISTFPYSKYKTDDIQKYKFVINLVAFGDINKEIIVINWIIKKFKDVNMTRSVDILINDGGVEINPKMDFLQYYFMPIWKYKTQNGNIEYIWLLQTKYIQKVWKNLIN